MKPVVHASLIISLFCMTAVLIPSANATVTNGTFKVLMTIKPSCSVTAGDITLAAANAGTGSSNSSSTISVKCSKTTTYNIGLAPSNNDTTGAGLMAGKTVGNKDLVAYQLKQTSASGAVWGNTATAITQGNGVAGVGDGTQKDLTVYAVVNNTDYVTPDNYEDTVTVKVNY